MRNLLIILLLLVSLTVFGCTVSKPLPEKKESTPVKHHSFIRWDTDGHKCKREGLLYFVERMDTREWYSVLGQWTRDPMKAKFFKSKELALDWVKDKVWESQIMPLTREFPEHQITEHIFQ